MQAKASQLIGQLPCSQGGGVEPQKPSVVLAQMLVTEAFGLQREEDQDLQKRIEAAQRKRNQITPAERERNRAERLRREEQIIDDAFGIYEVDMAGRENVGGRPAILLRFRPRLTYKPKTSEGKNMQHVAGRAWIDEQDHQIARVELEVIEPFSIGLGILAKLQKGASIVSERRKFNDEIWLPVKTEIALNARVLLLKGFNIRQILEYSEHKKYTVDTILKFSDVEGPRLDPRVNQEP